MLIMVIFGINILDKILPHFTEIEIIYYDPLHYGKKRRRKQKLKNIEN
jgi:hypothetical protein